MKNLFLEIANCIENNKMGVLARIVQRKGSAPRAVGTSCFVLEDKTLLGTIGGGLLELKVIEEATRLIDMGKTKLIHFRMNSEVAEEQGMICGGIVDVYLEPIIPSQENSTIVFKKIKTIIMQGNEALLLTKIQDGLDIRTEKTMMLILKDNFQVGSLGGAEEDKDHYLPKKIWKLKTSTLISIEGKPWDIFLDPIRPHETLFIFGAGHVSTFIAPLAKLVGFNIVIIDDRETFANKDRFPDADKIISMSFNEAFKTISIDKSSYIVIVTRGHASDRDVLGFALNTEATYIGMIGSRKKRDAVYNSLMKAGFSKKKLEKVHSPIGLDIGAETPEEIAISIVAELIKERAGKGSTL